MPIIYALEGGYVDPDSDGSFTNPLVLENATLIAENTVSAPVLMQPKSFNSDTGLYAWWRYKVEFPETHRHNPPYGEKGYVPHSAPGFYELKLDPTLTKYAFAVDDDEEFVTHSWISVSYTSTENGQTWQHTDYRLDDALTVRFNERSQDQFGNDQGPVTYGDVIIRVYSWFTNTVDYTTQRGPTFAVLRTSRISEITDYIQPENEARVISDTNSARFPHKNSGNADLANGEAHIVPTAGSSRFQAPGHSGYHRWARAIGGRNPWELGGEGLAWKTAQRGSSRPDIGTKVYYFNGNPNDPEYSGPPSAYVVPPVRSEPPSGSTGSQNAGRYGDSAGIKLSLNTLQGTLSIDTYGTAYTYPVDLVSRRYLGPRGTGYRDPSQMIEDIYAPPNEDGTQPMIAKDLWNLPPGNAQFQYKDILDAHLDSYEDGVHWEENGCEVLELEVAPDNVIGGSVNIDVPTRWFLSEVLERPGTVYTNVHMAGAIEDFSGNVVVGRDTFVFLSTGGDVPLWDRASRDKALFDSNRTSWVDVTRIIRAEIDLVRANKFKNGAGYEEGSGREIFLDYGECGYFYGVSATMADPRGDLQSGFGSNDTYPTDLLKVSEAIDNQYGEHTVQETGQCLAYRQTVRPSRYRVHMQPVLEDASPLYPEQMIDINFKQARRRFTGT